MQQNDRTLVDGAGGGGFRRVKAIKVDKDGVVSHEGMPAEFVALLKVIPAVAIDGSP